MTPLIHYATAGIMLLHALLGCCLHHEHCCAAEGLERSAVHADHHRHDDGCSGHARPTPEDAALEGPASEHSAPCEPAPCEPAPCEPAPCEPAPCEPAPCEPAPCESGDCVFVASVVSGFALDFECQWFDAARWAVAEQAAIVNPRSNGPPVHHGPPLAERVQAEYCIWLI